MTAKNNATGTTSAASEKNRSKETMEKTFENSMEKHVKLSMDSAGTHRKNENVRLLKDHGKQRIQICFRITEVAYHRLLEVSKLFEMSDANYAKAVLYKDLGVWTERLDYRRKKR